ncbi:arsenate reductase family protein [Rhodosalinus sp. 5P4]|uniref:arsenate reductase family protein n=1 Tax=Rhodosalinus sp. 5P4 TaxID=3239196 RepID=UPI0035240225
MLIYGLKTCDTCRKALKSLPEARLLDIRAEGMPEPVLRRAAAQFGPDLVNRRSTTWRALSEEDRALAPETLIARQPAVMKRPLIDDGGTLYLGWSDEVRAALVG